MLWTQQESSCGSGSRLQFTNSLSVVGGQPLNNNQAYCTRPYCKQIDRIAWQLPHDGFEHLTQIIQGMGENTWNMRGNSVVSRANTYT